MSAANAIGVDFGGVIVRAMRTTANEDTGKFQWASGADAERHTCTGALEGLRDLVALSGGRVWVVSKAGPAMQLRTLDWMKTIKFEQRTGIRNEQVRFCSTREAKRDICMELGISYFIDDRVNVMQILRRHVPHLFLFSDGTATPQVAKWYRVASNWPSVVSEIISHWHSD